MIEAAGTSLLRFVATADAPWRAAERTVVLDTTWTPGRGDVRIGLRDVAGRILATHDLNAETSRLLDGWVEASGVVDLTTVAGTSFWFYGRLRHWTWLQERLLWLWVLDDLLGVGDIGGIDCEAGADAGLLDMAGLVAATRGLRFHAGAPGPAPSSAAGTSASSVSSDPGRGSRAGSGARPGLVRRALRGLSRRLRPDPVRRSRAAILDRLEHLEREPGRLLVILQHAAQTVAVDGTTRTMNVYLDPVADRLRGTALDPVAVHTTAPSDELEDDPEAWRDRILPGAVLRALAEPADSRDAEAAAIADRVAAGRESMIVAGLDLGPALRTQVAGHLRRSLPWQLRAVPRIGRLLARLRPAALLLADEYHRQEWLAAAAGAGVPVVAIQHGLIFRWHNGYMFPSRPAALRLPTRLYVFGGWERRLVTETSIFRPDEVRVGGSPRLDFVERATLTDAPTDERTALRAELGIAEGQRMVVVSGTWGAFGRRFQVPIGLAGIIDRSLTDVHLVVKLHPGEPDEGPYRAVVAGAASARGIEPPPLTIVRSVDLYRLLAAADAHLGFQSTVVTEAVVVGTRNLLAPGSHGDILGWIAAGVAVPVHDGGDLLAALDDPGTIPAEAARAAFLADHFAPGSASERIAGELLTWLGRDRPDG